MVFWQEEAYTRTDALGHPISLEEYGRRHPDEGRFKLMSEGDAKIYAVTGVGFFLDAYDLFIINLVTPLWAYEYFGGLQHRNPHFPSLLRGLVNAAANIGNIFGQLAFGFLGDIIGRKNVYGKELIIAIIGIILVISLPNSIASAKLKMVWVICFRVVLGVGVGGDYPISAAIVSERSVLKRRGQLLGWLFSNQGWGTLAASIVTLIILACFEKALNSEGKYGQLDAVWRIQIGIALVPALALLWPRFKMPEVRKFLESRELNQPRPQSHRSSIAPLSPKSNVQDVLDAARAEIADHGGRMYKLDAAFKYFKEWRHLKTLLGTASTWFLMDIAFYGTNLNQSVILTEIGFATGVNEYDRLKRNAIGNVIIAVAGFVPGYFVTILFVEKLGRRWIQIQGFLITGLMFGIIAGGYDHLGTAGKFVPLAIAQFFFNFGPNATTFIIPAEAFPSRVRGFAHGVSAAAGKMGAILSALLFNYLSGPTILGLPNVLWIFFACCVLGAISTFFLIPETRFKDADAADYDEWLESNIVVI